MPHIILLGDSIFDNAAYTSGGPDVISQVQSLLPAGWRATLLAVDGSTTLEVPDQAAHLPADATHLVLSVGGNDAIMNSNLLLQPLGSTASALQELAEVSQHFESNYRRAVAACRQPGLPLTLCTIYNGNFPDASYQRLATTALMLFNDPILRVAFQFHLPVLDLRFLCSAPADYANPIEPSSTGGAKITRAIVDSLLHPANPAGRVFIA